MRVLTGKTYPAIIFKKMLKYINDMYPIRFSKNKWRIPINPPIKIIDVENTGKLNEIQGIDDIVIYARQLIINICFPLTNYAIFELNVDTGHLTRRELLATIYDLYKQVYDIEEATATRLTYSLHGSCEICENSEPYESIDISPGVPSDFPSSEKDSDFPPSEKASDFPSSEKASDFPSSEKASDFPPSEKCSICFEVNNDVKLRCGHPFHKTCIDQWLESSNTCPLCRTDLYSCERCTQATFTATVIPPEHRADQYRNNTDGLFGIYMYDMEKLVIEDLFFNKDGNINLILSADD